MEEMDEKTRNRNNITVELRLYKSVAKEIIHITYTASHRYKIVKKFLILVCRD